MSFFDMKPLLYFLPVILFVSSCAVQKHSDPGEEVLFTINGVPTVSDEFIYVYEKNNFNNDSIYTERDVDEYFNLFLNFKLKVDAAKSAGMDTTQSFIQEYNGYKNQLIKPYLAETKEQDRLVKEAYERMQNEIDASHILIAVAPDALPEDTIIAYGKILDIYKKAKSGQSFGELAVQYSEDPSAKVNQGRLGYFSALQMVFPFEEAAFTTPTDSVSDIIRSQFGYHILKVHDRRPSSGMVKVSHIMIQDKGDNAAEQKKIFEIYDQLTEGADWNELCKKYSDDLRTKNEGGALPFIGLRQINDAAFEAAAFGLENPGDISEPVRSKFGWHIIRLDEKKGIDPFDKMKEELEQRISKDERTKLSREAVVRKLKRQNNFVENFDARARLVQSADSSLLSGNWHIQITDSLREEMFFSIEGKKYSTAEVIEEIMLKQRQRTGISPQNFMNELIDAYIETSLTDYEEKQLVQNNREFRMLLNEYYEGILLFEIMNQKVWGRAVSDTTGLKLYFADNIDNYIRDTTRSAVIFSSEDPFVLTKIKKIVYDDSVKLSEIDFDSEEAFDSEIQHSLDSLVRLYSKYDQSVVTLTADRESIETELFDKIHSYLIDNNVQVQTQISEDPDIDRDKIAAVLNSKSKKSLEYLYNKESALTLQVDEGLFERGDLPLIDSLGWETGLYEFRDNKTDYLVYVNEIFQPQPQELNDVRGTVISDYQDYLEKVWIEELKNKNEIVINYTTLDKIKKKYKKKLAVAE